ncbi:S24 family peptidase [Shinella zoogloeoides]|uniref:XRE family transcriptional regulator n=1 Tax=Shinella zoogloeoides TaxID=352475 RepID=UPI0028ABD6CD|nr:S24 family peptidase [Shinella zoogloeoides]
MENALKNRILDRAEELGLTLEAVSLKAGLDRSYLRKLLDRPGASPKGETMNKLAFALDVPPAWFLDVKAPSAISDVSPANVQPPERNAMPNDVPVLGTAAGSHLRGAFQLSTDPIDWVRRPQGLMGAKDVYSVFVEGNSMEPQYFPGDLIFVHPHRPPRIGDAVIVQCQNGSEDHVEATLGIMHKRTAEMLIIRKHNPSAEVSLKRDRIISLHKVLTNNELYGL